MNERQELREFILNNIESTARYEGLIGGIVKAPFRVASSGIKSVGRGIAGAGNVVKHTIGGSLGAAGKALRGDIRGVGSTLKTSGKGILKGATRSIRGVGKDIGRIGKDFSK